jgi:hypothetical protein
MIFGTLISREGNILLSWNFQDILLKNRHAGGKISARNTVIRFIGIPVADLEGVCLDSEGEGRFWLKTCFSLCLR